ncbi:hypothetical protein [Fluviicola taffensis]|nr:hypothetical protein [Fluviicola taffensis]
MIFALYYLNTTIAQVDSLSPKISNSQLVDFEISKNSDLKEGILNLHSFISKQDTSLTICKDGIEYRDFILSEFFPEYYPLYYLEYHLLNILQINDTKFEVEILNKLDYEKLGNDYCFQFEANFIYNAILSKVNNKWVVDLSLRHANYQKQKTSFGNIYHLNNLNKGFYKDYKMFLKKTSKQFHLSKPNEKLNYIIGNFEIFGFPYSMSATNRYFKKFHLIVSKHNISIDKHEFSHYFFQDYSFGLFLNEGLAVYNGGSMGMTFTNFLKFVKETYIATFSDEEQKVLIEKLLMNQIEGGSFLPIYYACSGLILQEYFKKNGTEHFIELPENDWKIKPADFLSKYLEVPADKQVSYLIELLK